MEGNGKENLLAIMAMTVVAAAAAAVSGLPIRFCSKRTRSLRFPTEPSIEGKVKNMGRAWQDMGRAGNDSMAEGVHH